MRMRIVVRMENTHSTGRQVCAVGTTIHDEDVDIAVVRGRWYVTIDGDRFGSHHPTYADALVSAESLVPPHRREASLLPVSS